VPGPHDVTVPVVVRAAGARAEPGAPRSPRAAVLSAARRGAARRRFMPMGSMYDLIRMMGHLSEDVTQVYTRQLLCGVAHIHKVSARARGPRLARPSTPGRSRAATRRVRLVREEGRDVSS